jgi:hypothetical protein
MGDAGRHAEQLSGAHRGHYSGTGRDGEEAVKNPQGQETSLNHALQHSYNYPPARAVAPAIAERSGDSLLRVCWIATKPTTSGFTAAKIDVLLGYPSVKFSPRNSSAPAQTSTCLYPSPRPEGASDEVHLTVGGAV